MKTGSRNGMACIAGMFQGGLLLASLTAFADIHYVNLINPTPLAPYTNWTTAATNIQNAIDVSTNGDAVLVTNGVYATGGRVVYGAMTNRVAINKAITVRSVNGPGTTWIVGHGAGGGTTNGDGAIRCFYVGTNAVLSGFTLTNGHTRTSGDFYKEKNGGGLWCEVTGMVSNCVLTGNSAQGGGGSYYGTLNNCTLIGNSVTDDGGGSYYSTLNNCTLTDNSAGSGGGSCSGTLNNCTLTGNSATYDGGGSSSGTLNNCTLTGNSAVSSGGGSYSGTLNNCIVYYNTAPSGSNYSNGTFRYSCTTPLPSGTNNIDAEPRLASASHISALSPCIGRGSTNYTSGVDIDGEPWQNPPCMGADQYVAGAATGPLMMVISAAFTNMPAGLLVNFVAYNQGRISLSVWDFGDGTVVSNRACISHAWSQPGDYIVRLTGYNQSNPVGVSATVLVRIVGPPSYYVNVRNLAPVYPYTNWATAAQTIQQAIDAGNLPGRFVWVTNGIYTTGGRAAFGTMTNRVVLTENVEVRSVNGPAVTWIVGQDAGGGAIRCAYVGANAVLSGFTLTNGHTCTSGDYAKEQSGGGAWCEVSGTVSNCVLTGNSAYWDGGGSYYGTLNNCTLADNSAIDGGGGSYHGTLNNCTLTGNSASSGGGSASGTLNNCTLTGNSADNGGGSYQDTLNNCIVYYNAAPYGSNYSNGTFRYSCTAPLPSGTNNIDAEPMLASASHLSVVSPCIGRGSTNYNSGVDIDGEPWQNPPCMGADQYVAGAVIGPLTMAISTAYTNMPVGLPVNFVANNQGRISLSVWDFGDGTVVSNRACISHAWNQPGDYLVRLTGYSDDFPGGVSATLRLRAVNQPVYYVDASNPAPASPYTNWATAAHTIQEAIDARNVPGRLVWVTNGIYSNGGRTVIGTITNRVALTDEVVVRSVNGPEVTWIVGQGAGVGATNGDSAIRCAYVGAKAVLSGFTLTNGHTRTSGNFYKENSGGGAWCEFSGTVSNCVLAGNSASGYGGGSCYGTLNNCTLISNSAYSDGGASYSGTLNNCALTGNLAHYGGGSSSATLNNCTLTGNSAIDAGVGGGSVGGVLNNCTLSGNSAGEGGGSFSGTLNNCLLTGNWANDGGGSDRGTLNNCTLTGNSAQWDGGGSYQGALNNCVVYYNTAVRGSNYFGSTFNYSCTSPLSAGTGNIDVEPSMASDSHLSSLSPCIGRGNIAYATGVDIDGEPWQNPPCIGADQYVAGTIIGPLTMAISAAYTNVAAGFAVEFVAYNQGRIGLSVWDFGDGTVVSNRAFISHAWNQPGNFTVLLTGYNSDHPGGVSATMLVRVVSPPVCYVNAGNLAPVFPYTNWATAARTIQQAIDIGNAPGCLILVTNGVYSTGGRAVFGTMTNRVVLSEGTVVRSVNGPEVTRIMGQGAGGSTNNGDGAIRCAYVGAKAVLSGFTLTNGHTLIIGDAAAERSGGGVWCEVSGVVSNCVLTGNSADNGGGSYSGTLNNCWLSSNSASSGGGSYSGMLNNCTLTGNWATYSGGGSCNGTLNNCTLTDNSAINNGGGSYDGTLNNCTLTGNFADSGGGSWFGILNNCTLTGNSASYGGGSDFATLNNCILKGNAGWYGGGSFDCTLNNCMLIGNSASSGGGSYGDRLKNCTLTRNSASSGGGSYSGTLNNCIVYYNTAPSGSNYSGGDFNYCCTAPLPSGTNNITVDPMFVDRSAGDLRLLASSPCIDAGINQNWMMGTLDLDGNPRIFNGRVDMGAYETRLTLNLRVWLQGPYKTNTHAMSRGISSVIPTNSPHASDPRTVTAVPTNVMDWVLVELLSTNGNTRVSMSAFLDSQGQLLSDSGSTGITVEVSVGNYSIAVKHRNHLAVMSAQPVAFTNTHTTYDFTTGADKYSSGSNAAVELEPGVWGMMAGDADGNGAIQMVDGAICTNQLGQTGYNRADFNLDGVVNTADLALWQANMGLSTGMTNGGETALTWTLNITPIRHTVLSGATVTLTASGASNVVNWALASDPSGGTLVPLTANSAVYVAGTGSNCVDVVEAWDGNRLGRAWLNVISAADVTRVGKAIVMAGQRSQDDPVWPTTDYLGNLAYNTLLYRGFAKDNVQYLSPVTNEDVDGNGVLDDVAMSSTYTNVAMTFTNWAMSNPGQLFVYLVDHGGTSSGVGYFRLNASEVVTATNLNVWLDAIQNRYGIDVVVVLDFCESGSFVQPLAHSGPGKRTVITACASNEPTYFVAGGQVSFSDAFFGGLLTGLDVAGAFNLAQSAMSTYQSAQLDANGDGVYTPGTDVALVAGTYVGASFIAGKDVPQIGHVMGDQMLYGATTATLWAYDIASAYPLERVWCLVVPPGHNPNPTNPVADLPSLDLTYNPAAGRYEAQYSGFSEMGTYKLVYYAKDIWESMSQPKQSYVFQNGYQERVILAVGGNTNAANWPAIDNLARLAYNTFRSRHVDAQAIYYLSPLGFEDINRDGTNEVAGYSSLTNLSYAITNWAVGANKLTVYLVGEGANGTLRLNPAQTLAPADLKGWLDAYQASNGEAQVVMDFSGSEAFLPVLKAPIGLVRICIASSQANKTSLFGNGGMVSFSKFFLNGLSNGDSIGQAFAHAQSAIKLMSGAVRQAALLDDNGDGLSSKTDGAVAATHYIGSAFRTGADAPVIGTPMTNATIALNGSLVLWAQDVTAVAGISNVWCLVTSPDYDGTGDLPQTNLTWNTANSRYEVFYTNFTQLGTYACTFYAGDNLGLLSSAQQSTVTILSTNLSLLAVSAFIGADNSFNVTYQGYIGRNYAFDESTNLINWLPLLTNQIQLDGLLRFSTTNPPAKTQAFYRARLVP